MGTTARKGHSIQTEYLTKIGLNIQIGSKRLLATFQDIVHHMTKKISSARILNSVHKVYLSGDHRNSLLSNNIILSEEYEFLKSMVDKLGNLVSNKNIFVRFLYGTLSKVK